MIDLGRGVQLIRRSEWGARSPRSTQGIDPTFGTTCHWEGPAMGSFPHASCFTKVRVIQNFHMDTREWVDIAYTALACPHGFVFEGRWIGRRTAANGTSVGNATGYALCYLGGVGDPFTQAGRIAMRAGLDYLDANGRAGPGRNGHRDWKNTQCPGDTIYAWVHAGQPAGVLEDEGDDILAALNDDEQRELLRLLREIHGETAATGEESRLWEVTVGVRKLLKRSAPGYFAVNPSVPGTTYYVAGDNQSKLGFPTGGTVHSWLGQLHGLQELSDDPVALSGNVLDGIPDVA